MSDNVKLNDSVIAHLVKLIQVGLLTGTDIVDHFRMIRLDIEDGELFLNEEYETNHETNLQKMLDQASELQQQETETSED